MRTRIVASILIFVLLATLGVLADSYLETKSRLESIEKRAFEAARTTAVFARNDVVLLKELIEDLKAYNCNPYKFREEDPALFTLYSQSLVVAWNNAFDLARYLSIAYKSKEFQPPEGLISSLSVLGTYYVELKNTIMRYSSAKYGEAALNCEAIDMDALNTIEAALEELSILDSIDEITLDLAQRIRDSVSALEPITETG